MAKKKPAGAFVLTGAVRDVLKKDSTLKASQVIEAIRKEHPGEKFNEASAKVAFSNERKKLGIARKRRRKVRKPRPVMVGAMKKGPRALNLDLLQAAKSLLAAAGSSENALAALRQVASLQVK
jgi:hypothetical protein